MKVYFNYNDGRNKKMDIRHAKILTKLKRGTYMTRELVADKDSDEEELYRLRLEYQALAGKKAFHGWNAGQLREKIAEFSHGGE